MRHFEGVEGLRCVAGCGAVIDEHGFCGKCAEEAEALMAQWDREEAERLEVERTLGSTEGHRNFQRVEWAYRLAAFAVGALICWEVVEMALWMMGQ